MRKNDKMIVTIEDETNLGYGVSKVDGMVIFIPDVMPLEQVEIQITKVKKTYAYARVVSIIKQDSQRVNPKCEVAKICGGCQLQYRTYTSQQLFKQKNMETLFSDYKVLDCISADQPWYYRNKAQFPVQIKDGKVIMGFYRKHSNDIVQNSQCCIQSPSINEIYQFLQKNLTLEDAAGLRHIFVRSSKQGQSQIVFIGKQNNGWDALIQKLIKEIPDVVSIFYNHNDMNNNVILGDTFECLYGESELKMQYMDLEVFVSFQSFFQVNTQQMEKLYQVAADAFHPNKEMRVVEFYSGLGTIGMSIADRVKEVIGVDIVPSAVEDARKNCEINGIKNCFYECKDATEFAAQMVREKQKVDVVIVDPPRKGCSLQGIEDMSSLNAKNIVYVSCNPVTLKRDIKHFEEKGYQVQWIQPVDLFPQTIHVEAVCLLNNQNEG